MDDSCAVCADTLEWVAYGPCGHREVCSTCVARLRFICDDRRCCICKTECNFVFVTKALGDYTKMISDFSTLPSEVREGQVGSYWYHEDTQAFFDDVDHYKMIKAMCRLSCSVCDKMEEQQHHDGHRRRTRFRNIGQLKGHLIHQHKLFMCNLCLEGRKVFICEQKLYTRSQLNQHMRTGDSVVDGTESERGGFAGHPMCQFCRDSFYGDNELYSHMSTEHFTCHICQRQHPGQYEYYRDYNDLEMHFRRDHFLCEDEACLAKKFIVFPSEQELKRHNALEHGGRMSRSKRNAVLQIPTSFTYRSSNESGNRRGRGRTFRREFDDEDNQLNMAIQASIDFASRGDRFPDPPSSSARASRDDADPSDVDPLIQPFESLATADSEPSSRYRQAVSHSSSVARLGESSFPPLSATHSQQKSEHETDGSRQETMAARLSRRDNVSVLNAANLRQNRTQGPAPSAPWPMMNNTQAPMSGPGQIRPTSDGSGLSGYASSLQGRLPWGLRNPGTSGRLNHSALAPNLAESKSFDPVSDFPPVSAAQSNRVPSGSQGVKTKDIQSANKTLVEKIRAALGNDEDKYTTFKVISQEYRQGIIDTWDYLGYVKQFGLSHLVPDLARLCPDTLKQKELVATYIATLQSNGSLEALQGNGGSHSRESGSSRKKEKGKNMLDGDSNSSKETLADSVLATVRRLQSDQKPFGGEVEVLSKDDYRATKGKSLGTGTMQNDRYLAVGNGTSQALGDGGGGSKQKKKTSKFHRVRLGESSAVLDLRSSNADPSPNQAGSVTDVSDPSQALPVRSAWRSGGGQKLFRR